MKTAKKLIAWAMALLVFLTASVSAGAAGFTVDVGASAVSVPRCGSVEITVTVDSVSVSDGLLSVDVPLCFDGDVFQCEGVEASFPEEWGTPENFSYTSLINGVLWLRMINNEDTFDNSGCTDGGKMTFKVSLRVKSTAPMGKTKISAEGDGVFLVLVGTVADGVCSPTYGKGEAIDITVTEQVGVFGDVNGDGKADNLDAAYILRYDALIIDLTPDRIYLGDVNGDGKLTSLDASVVLKYDAGIITQFPIQQ